MSNVIEYKIDLPKYRSHKIVEAFKIGLIMLLADGVTRRLLPPVGESWYVDVGMEYFKKHAPAVGGYYVRYPDGYESYSPAEAFESGYTEAKPENRAAVVGEAH